MPAYAKDGKVVCFFQGAEKFKSRYATFGFSDEANLDKDGTYSVLSKWQVRQAPCLRSTGITARTKRSMSLRVSTASLLATT